MWVLEIVKLHESLFIHSLTHVSMIIWPTLTLCLQLAVMLKIHVCLVRIVGQNPTPYLIIIWNIIPDPSPAILNDKCLNVMSWFWILNYHNYWTFNRKCAICIFNFKNSSSFQLLLIPEMSGTCISDPGISMVFVAWHALFTVNCLSK